MRPLIIHPWKLDPRAAAALQRELARAVRIGGPGPRSPLLVAGCDAAGSGRWARRDQEIVAGVIVLRFPGWEIVETATARGPAPFPYIPGLLSFREAPLYIEAFAKLRQRPDLLLCDGQGIAHPRGLGLASHLGVLFDLPSIGVAKSRLTGEHREPGRRRGCSTRLVLPAGEASHGRAGATIGRVVRTRDRVRPLFVSPGHRIGVDAAARWVLALAPHYRLPEPTRLADQWVGRLREDPDAAAPAAHGARARAAPCPRPSTRSASQRRAQR
jgi:deoxyribonuclease V